MNTTEQSQQLKEQAQQLKEQAQQLKEQAQQSKEKEKEQSKAKEQAKQAKKKAEKEEKAKAKEKKKNAEKEIDEIIQKFNSQIMLLFKFAEKKDKISNNPDVERVIRLVKIAKSISPESIIEGCLNNFWANREYIIERNEVFIMSKENVDRLVNKNDEDIELIESLINFFRNIYKTFTNEDKEYLWDCINNMLQFIIRYRIVKGDFV